MQYNRNNWHKKKLRALLIGSLMAALTGATIAFMPAGSSAKPIGQSVAIVFIALGTLFIGVKDCIIAVARKEPLNGIVYLCLSLLPLPIGVGILFWLAHLKNLNMDG